ncbi:hypothetical protein BCV72DRAFT_198895, partial [Rhizopus microsporus var. microsporus]
REAIFSDIPFQGTSEVVQCCSKRSSPGCDDLLYEMLRLIIDHPEYQELVLRFYNDALGHALFPASWRKTCVVLLPKSSALPNPDTLSNFDNWLINADCKVFTRLINSRVMFFSDSPVNRYPTNFMHGRLISDHAMMCKLIMYDTLATHSDAVGVMLDQTKAYDRIHPEYLGQILLRFGLW